MAAVADRVKETSTTTGTGDLTLAGAASNYQSFNTAFGLQVVFYYAIVHQSATEWEVGEGFLSGSTTLVRLTVRSSTNSNNAVSLSAGTKDVFCTIAAISVQDTGRIVATSMGMNLP